MKVVYIAGPFRASTPWGVECNVRNAEVLALAVAACGAMPLCPHTMTRHFDGQLTDEFWLSGTLELLRRCDALVLVDGWERSSGTRAEAEEAKRLGLPIFDAHQLVELKAWAAESDGEGEAMP
jgi:hypothetical protein